MCGISGIININGRPVTKEAVKMMTDSISHRGPDGEGYWMENNVGLGHRRLAILDLSTYGDQPMISVDHRYVLTYNGEVYNYKEIRKELEALGYWFRSNTDTEVVLNAMSHWGTDAIPKFNGMFAFGLWDRKEKTLVLARDRYGTKPLYFSLVERQLLFASEQKAITTNKDFRKELDKNALYEYLTFQNILSTKTLLQKINLLPAGHFLELNADTGNFKETKYWDFNFGDLNENVDEREQREELKRLFNQAVKRNLTSDVEIGSYLSGGIDSGSITALASNEISNLKTFTCGFDLASASGIELAFDERQKAEMMSGIFKTEHYEIVLKAGDMERCLESLAWHLEEPRVGQSYPNFYAAKLASKFVKVALSGCGGDELFAGYPWRYYRNDANGTYDEFINCYYKSWHRLATEDQIRRLCLPIQNDIEINYPKKLFERILAGQISELKNSKDYINKSLYFEAKTFLHGLLVVEDKLSMAHSLETRVPFLDNDLVDFAMRCPVHLKLSYSMDPMRTEKGETQQLKKSNDGKIILRNMLSDYIPESVTTAVKQGFSSPDSSWFRGDSIEFIKKVLMNKNAIIYNYLDKDEIFSIINSHTSGKENRRLSIWSLLNLETWMKKNLD
jgi:asparagine synthase (glutamine-hydrolysing)